MPNHDDDLVKRVIGAAIEVITKRNPVTQDVQEASESPYDLTERPVTRKRFDLNGIYPAVYGSGLLLGCIIIGKGLKYFDLSYMFLSTLAAIWAAMVIALVFSERGR